MYNIKYDQKFRLNPKGKARNSSRLAVRFNFDQEVAPKHRETVIERIAHVCSINGDYLAPEFLKSDSLEIYTHRNFFGRNLKLFVCARSPNQRLGLHQMVDVEGIKRYVLTGNGCR